MSYPQQQFQNEHITATVERHPGCQVRIDISVTPEAAKAAHHKAIKAVSKEVSFPGFRKGKAPEAVVMQNFSHHVEREWKEILTKTTFREAMQLTNIYPFSKDSAKANLKAISMDGASLSIEFEASPVVPSVNPQELPAVHVARRNVGEKEVSQAIENFRLHHAEWHAVSDRPAAENDYVDLDIETTEEPVRSICKDARFEIAPSKMGTWMRKLIIGMTPGQSAEGMSEKDESDKQCEKCESGDSGHHHEHEEHFEPKLCRITLKAIQQPTIPELEAGFLSKFGFTSADDLQQRLEKELNKQAEYEYNEQRRKAMENILLEKCVFDIPESLIAQQLEGQKKNILEELKESGLSRKDLAREAEIIGKDVIKRIERDFKIYFLAQKLAEDFHIEIRQEELMEELGHQIMLQQMGQSSIDLSMDPKELRSRLIVHLTVNKALDFLIESAKAAP